MRPPRSLPGPFVYHANVNGARARANLLAESAANFEVVSLEDPRFHNL